MASQAEMAGLYNLAREEQESGQCHSESGWNWRFVASPRH